MTATDDLNRAIADSVQENRIVSIEYVGDIGDCIADLSELHDGEIDYARENDGSYDVWGWTDETPESEQDWRLNVRCTGA
jgi:hypothetical protein